VQSLDTRTKNIGDSVPGQGRVWLNVGGGTQVLAS
jgi:hypothetical protein